jgi:hypothetical protein
MLWLGFAGTIAAGVAICVLSDWIEQRKLERREATHSRRGFEVKYTGDSPVSEKKENDHG